MFNEQEMISLFKREWDNVPQSYVNKIINENGGISAFECILMHLYILTCRPRAVVEFSPNYGYSTQALAMAQKTMRNRYCMATFDINKNAIAQTETRINKLNLDEYCEVISGDAIKKVPDWIKRKDAKVDLIFIDSDHRAEFANKYIKKIFPLLQDNCLIGVHDICSTKRTSDGVAPFKTSLLGGNHSGGEEDPIRDYVGKSDHCVLHSITGGKHEGANLPVNTKFYKEIEKITSIDFSNVSHACPKTLFIKKG